MNDRQELQWLYAKGLELAISLKGVKANPEILTAGVMVDDYINAHYNDLALRIARKIIAGGMELTGKG